MSISKNYNNFNDLKQTVEKAGLLKRVPIRGSFEMIMILVAISLTFYTMELWNPILLGLAMTIIFTRSVFVAHDILHNQYFKSKKLSFNLSYTFSNIILANSSAWWNFKHNINHHTFCNIVGKDEDINAMDRAFTGKYMGGNKILKKYKYFIFWGAMFFMYPAFIRASFKYVIKNKHWGEFVMMLLHFPIIWGSIFYTLPISDAIIVALTLNFTLSPWLSFGFITNHLGCEVFNQEEGKKLNWLELQMRTSRSLIGGRVVHWFYGGLNTQIEHHLFPKAPRFNLLKVQNLTREFAKQNNLFYFETTPLRAYIQINDILKTY